MIRATCLTIAAAAALASPLAAQNNPARTIGLTRAVAAAERALPGIALEAELEAQGGRLVYEVELLSKGRIHDVRIDARSGRMLANAPARVESMWRAWFDADWATMSQATRPLAPRLATLERQAGGTVRDVGFDVEGGIPIYEVEIATAAGRTEIHFDARSGQRLPMAFDN